MTPVTTADAHRDSNDAPAAMPAGPSSPSPPTDRQLANMAALTLLAFTALVTVSLVSLFRQTADPWSWRSALMIAVSALGLATSLLVWRAPSRTHVAWGGAVVVASLVRFGAPDTWSWKTALFGAMTLLFLAPLVRAFIGFGRADRA